MSINEIKLPPMVIAEMFKYSLIEAPTIILGNTLTENPFENTLQFLGSNLKHILVLVNYPAEKFLPEEALRLLIKVLKACNLNMEDIAIVNTAWLKSDFTGLKEKIGPETILLFGKHSLPDISSSDARLFNIITIDGISVLSAPPLESLTQKDAESQLLKSKFWVSLQKLFKVETDE